jgi:hypothetical protein
MRTLLSCCLPLLLVAGCGDRPAGEAAPPDETTAAPAIFAGLPLLPGSRVAGGTGNAAEAVVTVPLPPDSVAQFYRRVLADRAWDLRGDVTDRDGQITLHGRSPQGRPLWIIVRPAGPGGSTVSVIATAVDSGGAVP